MATVLNIATTVALYTKLHAILFLFLASLGSLFYTKYATPLRRFPGPPLASFSRLWQVFTAYSACAEEKYLEVHRKYGSVARIGPNEASFANATAALDVFKAGKGFHKTEVYSVFLPRPATDIFTEIRESVHAAKKRIASPFYTILSIQQRQGQIEALMHKFLAIMDSFASEENRVSVDIGRWLHYFAFDVLGEFAFAESFGFLDEGIDINDTIPTIGRSTYESAIVGQVPIIESLTRSNPLWKYIPLTPKGNMSFLVNIATACIAKFQPAQSPDEKTKSLLNSLMAAHQSKPDTFSPNYVFSISMGAM